jgi:hypothetical protein
MSDDTSTIFWWSEVYTKLSQLRREAESALELVKSTVDNLANTASAAVNIKDSVAIGSLRTTITNDIETLTSEIQDNPEGSSATDLSNLSPAYADELLRQVQPPVDDSLYLSTGVYQNNFTYYTSNANASSNVPVFRIDENPYNWALRVVDTPNHLDPIENVLDPLFELPTIEAVPTLSGVTPPITLGTEFDFVDVPYTSTFSSDIYSAIVTSLNGEVALDSNYWDGVWLEAAGKFGLLAYAKNRNTGRLFTASTLRVPTETHSVSDGLIADDTIKAETIARLDKMVMQSLLAREDFIRAIGVAVSYDGMLQEHEQKRILRLLNAAKADAASTITLAQQEVDAFMARIALEDAKLVGNNLRADITFASYQADLENILTDLRVFEKELDDLILGIDSKAANLGNDVDYLVRMIKYDKISSDYKENQIKLWKRARSNLLRNYAARTSVIEALAAGFEMDASTKIERYNAGFSGSVKQYEATKSFFDNQLHEKSIILDQKLQAWSRQKELIQVAERQIQEQLSTIVPALNGYVQSLVAAMDISMSGASAYRDTYITSDEESASRNSEKVQL